MTRSHNRESFVIAITGASGAGKTALVKAVTALLDDAVSLYLDDYASTHQPPEDLADWYKRGTDPYEWRNPRFLRDLRHLRSGMPITPPNSDREIKPARIILMEEPFGRTREGMDKLVDFVACIDVPLDIALARRTLRTLDQALEEKTTEKSARKLREHMLLYLNESGRDLYSRVNELAMRECELILDGVKPVSQLAEELVRNVHHAIASKDTG